MAWACSTDAAIDGLISAIEFIVVSWSRGVLLFIDSNAVLVPMQTKQPGFFFENDVPAG